MPRKRDRLLAIEAVKQYRILGMAYDAEALIVQFQLSAKELGEING